MKQITSLISHLQNYLEQDIYQLPPKARNNSYILHYYSEIIRHWNTLNYIINKTIRYMGLGSLNDPFVNALFFFLAYRVYYEQADLKRLKRDIIQIISTNPKYKKITNLFIDSIQSFSMNKALRHKKKAELISIQYSIPTFAINRLKNYLSLNRIQEEYEYMDKLGNAVFEPLRINSLATTKSQNEIIQELIESLNLQDDDILYDEHIPEIIYIPSKYKSSLLTGQLYRQGSVIFHDKASSMVVQCLDPQPQDRILDMCAAPGIKTSLMAQYVNNKASIVANDFSFQRIFQSKRLLNRLNVRNIFYFNADASLSPLRDGKKVDKILLDAPCTGSGTFASNPELKWRQNWDFLNQNLIFQENLLQNAIHSLDEEGILVYSVCSLYPQEGEFQVRKYMDQLEPLDLSDWLSPSYTIEEKTIQGTGRLFPTRQNTQGFFIAKFKKKGA